MDGALPRGQGQRAPLGLITVKRLVNTREVPLPTPVTSLNMALLNDVPWRAEQTRLCINNMK